MKKLEKKNLFIEIKDNDLIVAVGEYDSELNFLISEKEIISSSGFNNGKVINLDKGVENLKKAVNKIEKSTKTFFSDVNLIINQTDFDCINISGFKKLNGNQVLSDDISYILNDIKLKLLDTEKLKTIIHLFNTKFLLDDKPVKNLPIGLYGDFYSHQLTFFMIENNELKNINTLLNKCNLNLNKIVLKSFIEGINIAKNEKKDTFLKIVINKQESYLIFFFESSFCFFQRFNFGSDIILKDISKVCSIEMTKVLSIVSNSNFETADKNNYVDKKYLDKNSTRKISLQHINEISSARIEEILNVIFLKNKNLNEIDKQKIPLYLNLEDKMIAIKFKEIFNNNLNKNSLKFIEQIDEDPLTSIKIFGDLLSKGWAKEAIPVLKKKRSWISKLFSGLFE